MITMVRLPNISTLAGHTIPARTVGWLLPSPMYPPHEPHTAQSGAAAKWSSGVDLTSLTRLISTPAEDTARSRVLRQPQHPLLLLQPPLQLQRALRRHRRRRHAWGDVHLRPGRVQLRRLVHRPAYLHV